MDFAEEARTWAGICISEKLPCNGDFILSYRAPNGDPVEPKILIDNKDKSVIAESSSGLTSDRYCSIHWRALVPIGTTRSFSALSLSDEHRSVVRVDIVQFQLHTFSASNSSRIQSFEQRPISQPAWVMYIWLCQYCLDFLNCECMFWQAASDTGQFQVYGWNSVSRLRLHSLGFVDRFSGFGFPPPDYSSCRVLTFTPAGLEKGDSEGRGKSPRPVDPVYP